MIYLPRSIQDQIDIELSELKGWIPVFDVDFKTQEISCLMFTCKNNEVVITNKYVKSIIEIGCDPYMFLRLFRACKEDIK